MFYIYWALKNIVRGGMRSIRFLFFLSLIVGGLFFMRGIFRGTEVSMEESLRKYHGDVIVRAQLSTGLPFSVDELREECGPYLERVVEEHAITGVLAAGRLGFDRVVVVGTNGGYFDVLQDVVEWVEGSSERPKMGRAVMDETLASKLGVKIGDTLLLQFRTKEELQNTAQVVVGGLFRGNKYVIGNRIYVSLQEAHTLAMEDILTTLHLYLRGGEEAIRRIESYLVPYSNAISVGMVVRNPESSDMFVAIFDLYHTFFGLFIWMFSVVFFLVLYFGVQNTIFLRFHERKEEVSTLMAFGMGRGRFVVLVGWEMLMFFLGALSLGYLMSWLASRLVSLVRIMEISSEMVVLVGGPRFLMYLVPGDVFLLSSFVLGVVIIGTGISIARYLSREVVGMTRGLY